MRNVEIKARVNDVSRLLELAKEICAGQNPATLQQHDTFFRSPSGRLKLRVATDDCGKETAELIFYDRPDVEGPKVSNFHKALVDDHKNLKEVLSLSMGVLGEVKKQRVLYMYVQTRIHIDQVEGIGNFMELEVCLKDDQTAEEGQQIAESIMQMLEVHKSQLVSGAYMDFLLNSSSKGDSEMLI